MSEARRLPLAAEDLERWRAGCAAADAERAAAEAGRRARAEEQRRLREAVDARQPWITAKAELGAAVRGLRETDPREAALRAHWHARIKDAMARVLGFEARALRARGLALARERARLRPRRPA